MNKKTNLFSPWLNMFLCTSTLNACCCCNEVVHNNRRSIICKLQVQTCQNETTVSYCAVCKEIWPVRTCLHEKTVQCPSVLFRGQVLLNNSQRKYYASIVIK